jgi:hypothetical protein
MAAQYCLESPVASASRAADTPARSGSTSRRDTAGSGNGLVDRTRQQHEVFDPLWVELSTGAPCPGGTGSPG